MGSIKFIEFKTTLKVFFLAFILFVLKYQFKSFNNWKVNNFYLVKKSIIMRNHKLANRTIDFILNNVNNYYIDDLYSIINSNEYENQNINNNFEQKRKIYFVN